MPLHPSQFCEGFFIDYKSKNMNLQQFEQQETFKIEFANYLMNSQKNELQEIQEWYTNQTNIFPIIPIENFCEFKGIEYIEKMNDISEKVFNEIGYYNF